ncbi:MAG TPA: alpha-L-rhamnosidase C-terminal domain-containing protein [Candidatus Aquilonibacter sp.]|nr:alpha-L-rhamnosidase C-terminal domain-containing protein [Candidatus Aquilonibacter sp.]
MHRKQRIFYCNIAVFLAGAMALAAHAQDLPLTQNLTPSTIEPLDPTRNASSPILESSIHKPLPEQYIWTASDHPQNEKLIYTFPAITEQTEPHYFRSRFHIDTLPPEATLYIAGPRSVSVWINGQLAERVSSDTSSPLGMHVFAAPVAKFLRSGDNVIAIQAVRGRGVTGFANSAIVRQQTFGQVLVAKIVPRELGVEAPDLMHTTADWRSSATLTNGWEQPDFDDARWKPVMSLGGIESNIELFQWNADAGLYNWPGYDGISPFLAHMPLRVETVLASYSGRGHFDNLSSLTTGTGDLQVHLPAAQLTEAPSLFIDFGREITGRLEIDSDSDSPIAATIELGESESEALKVPYLGVNQLTIPAHGTGHSPKSAFRYAKVRFLSGPPELRIKSIHADHIYYPVKYQGSFESSDPLLNRIWETGAYTAHLCMQDDVWDASKRDRGRWMGDTDVSGPVIEDVFADRMLLEDTLDRLLGPDHQPVDQHVNGIPGYSSFWFTGVADFYRHTGDKSFLEREHQRMLELLHLVDGEFDSRDIYANKSNVWLYVDWSPDFNGDTPETRRATTLEFLRAYREASFLLREIGDNANADKYAARADALKVAADKYLTDPATGTFGPRWQTNAAAVISGAADPSSYPAIWNDVLSHVGKEAGPGLGHGPIITPYYGDYVLRAMAEMNHRADALAWMRQFWGGMLSEGATSFWEGYDVDWYKEDFHSSLQADNRSGYFVSLAHGWSSGPTAWLMEEILGIQPTGPGFDTVNIRPDLAGLEWARGAMPTPHGLIKVDVRKRGAATDISVDIPDGATAQLSAPVGDRNVTTLRINGKPEQAEVAEGGARRIVTLRHAGHYVIDE